MKLLIGIMYCIENEFSQCIKSIKSQTYKKYDYFIIDKLPNKEAHNKLFKTFTNSAGKYDLFIKIDSDMVLTRNSFFDEVVTYFSKNPDTDDLQIAVHDNFTNRLIYGLHVYSNRMRWTLDNENIFVDWPDNQQPYKQVNDESFLAPAAWHCPNPSNFQAFHFGIHKMIKITQHDRTKLRVLGSLVHWDNILELIKHYRQTRQMYLAYALVGSFEALKKSLSSMHVNFDNDRIGSIFKQWETKSDAIIQSKADRFCFYCSLLPDNMALQLILLHRNLSAGDWKFALRTFLSSRIHNSLSLYRKEVLSMKKIIT